MTLNQITIRPVLSIFCILVLFISSSNLKAESSQAVVPLKINVNGRLVITDAENDTVSGKDPTLNVYLKLTPDLGSSVVSGSSSIRIRTNLNRWILTAKRSPQTGSTNINPKDISLNFVTSAGSKANPHAAELISPFNGIANLSQIKVNSPTKILNGISKTSVAKDHFNKDNWYQLTANYSTSPDFFLDEGDFNTQISYNLVSP